MIKGKIASQIEFKSLEEFIKAQNNYYFHFLGDCEMGLFYREKPHFKRFQEKHPELEKEMTVATVQAIRAVPKRELPYEQLWKTYNLMSKLVFVDDPHVMKECEPDNRFLVR